MLEFSGASANAGANLDTQLGAKLGMAANAVLSTALGTGVGGRIGLLRGNGDYHNECNKQGLVLLIQKWMILNIIWSIIQLTMI